MIDADKLQQMKNRGILSEEDYLEHKKNLAFRILNRHREAAARSGVVYILLAFFLGATGVHNFYAGYWQRGLVQLFFTLISWAFMFIPLLFVSVWAFLELLLVNKSANGKLFSGNSRVILILRFSAVFLFAIAFSNTHWFYESEDVQTEMVMPNEIF